MKEPAIEFKLLDNEKEYPYELLLLADETIDAIHKYLFKSEVYVALLKEETVAVCCLYEADPDTWEIKNIAVSEKFQSKGIGGAFIAFIKALAKKRYPTLMVGTADCGLAQIRFYEKHGFKKFGVRKNFFIENYDQPILENGIQLKDMVLLKILLKHTR